MGAPGVTVTRRSWGLLAASAARSRDMEARAAERRQRLSLLGLTDSVTEPERPLYSSSPMK